jgi:hypothetical protein
LNGEPDFSPEGLLSRRHAGYVESEDLIDMIRRHLRSPVSQFGIVTTPVSRSRAIAAAS